jgi:hypothetical protein
MKQLDVVRKNGVLTLLVILTLVSSIITGVLTVAVVSGDTSERTEFRYDVNTEGVASSQTTGNGSAISFESLSEFEQTQIERAIGDGGIYGGGEVTTVTSEKKHTVIDGVGVVSIDGVSFLVTVDETQSESMPLVSILSIVSNAITLGLIILTTSEYRYTKT